MCFFFTFYHYLILKIQIRYNWLLIAPSRLRNYLIVDIVFRTRRWGRGEEVVESKEPGPHPVPTSSATATPISFSIVKFPSHIYRHYFSSSSLVSSHILRNIFRNIGNFKLCISSTITETHTAAASFQGDRAATEEFGDVASRAGPRRPMEARQSCDAFLGGKRAVFAGPQ